MKIVGDFNLNIKTLNEYNDMINNLQQEFNILEDIYIKNNVQNKVESFNNNFYFKQYNIFYIKKFLYIIYYI